MTHPPPTRFTPHRDLALATHLSHWHARTRHHLSPSECETLPLAELLSLADPDDTQRWQTLKLGYTDPSGPLWLREAAVQGFTTLQPDELACFAGAQEALFATLHALLAATDHVIVVLPCYPSMETIPLGLCAVSGVALNAADHWSLDIDAIAAAIRPNTRLISISFPNNPTGKQLEQDRFAALIALCRHHGLWLLSDEVYRLTEYDPASRLPHAADAYERGISLGAMSKAYGLPGLRIAWVGCRDPGLRDRLATLRQYLSTCSAAPSEILASIALKAADRLLARNRAITAANWTRLSAFFARHPDLFACEPPQGGMVCYPHYLGPEGAENFVIRIAEQSSVMLLPASVFASELLRLPAGHLRIGFGRLSFPAGLEALEHALQTSP